MLYLSICVIFLSSLSYSFPSTGPLLPWIYSFFDAVVNGIVSWISLSNLSLLVYRNARDFYVLILYPATLSNSLIVSKSFLVAPFDMYSMMSFANSDNFASFPIWILFIFLLIALTRTFKGRRQWHPNPVLLPGKSHGWRSLVGCSPWGR